MKMELSIQLLIIYYFPGLVFKNPIWGGGESGRFLAAVVAEAGFTEVRNQR